MTPKKALASMVTVAGPGTQLFDKEEMMARGLTLGDWAIQLGNYAPSAEKFIERPKVVRLATKAGLILEPTDTDLVVLVFRV